MKGVPNNIDKRHGKNGKRLLLPFKRSFFKIKTLAIPGRPLYHILFIGIYIGYEMAVSLINGENYGWKVYLPFYIVFVGLFYLYAHVLYPTVKFNGDSEITVTVLLLLCLLVAVLSVLCINHIIRYFLTGELSLRTPKRTFTNAAWRSVNLMILSAVYWLYFNMLYQKRHEINILKRQAETERNLFEMQIAYENSRINPHFLFNTLQFIYKEVEQISPEAEEATANLVEIMRYLLSPSTEDRKVPLVDEIRAVDTFMAMAKQRFGSSFYLNYYKTLNNIDKNARIPPHMVLTIAENLIKHGRLADEQKPADLSINCIDNVLNIHCRNYKPPAAGTRKSGVGLQNLKTRLAYFYGGNHHLKINESKELFHLEMTIML